MKPSIWVEKYRPRSIKDVIFQDDRQQKLFEKFVADQDIPHLFLCGIQGTGKTSVSKALINDLGIDRADVLRINCSKDKIDAMRNQVDSFAMTMPLGKFKVVQLEECDYLSLDGQALLRGLIEETSATCRYIITCNYENKIIPALKDRFQRVSFKTPDRDAVLSRMVRILEAENVDIDDVVIDYIDDYVSAGYPSIRAIIQLLQLNTHGKTLQRPNSAAAVASDWKLGLLDTINKGDFKAARKLVCESATREEHEDVYTFLYQNIDKLKVNDKEAAIITIAEYLRSHALVADTEINLAACFIALSRC